MSETLTVTIPLTDEMRSPEDLAAALRYVALEIQAGHGNGRIRGLLGDFVGTWDIVSPEQDRQS